MPAGDLYVRVILKVKATQFRRFFENDEFGPGGRHALSLQQQIAEIRITTKQGGRRRTGRPLSARTELVLALAAEHPDWGTGQIAAAAVVSHRAVWNVLHRHRPGRQDVQQAAGNAAGSLRR